MKDKFDSMMRYEKVNLLTKVFLSFFVIIAIVSMVTGLWIYLLALVAFLAGVLVSWMIIHEIVDHFISRANN